MTTRHANGHTSLLDLPLVRVSLAAILVTTTVIVVLLIAVLGLLAVDQLLGE